MPRLAESIRIIGTGMTALGKLGRPAVDLQREALEKALASSSLALTDLDGLVAVPSLSQPKLMQAHYLATKTNLLPRPGFLVRTLDTGGAGPISAIIQARSMIKHENCQAVAIVAGDAVASMETDAFLERADGGIGGAGGSSGLDSPVIPNGYSRITEWQMQRYDVSPEQLAKLSVLMSWQASQHPAAMTQRPHTLDEVLSARRITPHLGLLECARRADGAAAAIVASSRFLERKGLVGRGNGGAGDVLVLGTGGEGSGPLYPPRIIDESMFSCEAAAKNAYEAAHLRCDDIDVFSLYDCFPICLLRAVEAVGLAPKGGGGAWCDEMYDKMLKAETETESASNTPFTLPVNPHGGLLSFGAPWETPAMFGALEVVDQLLGKARGVQIEGARRGLVYGNGGIFSASAVALLARAD